MSSGASASAILMVASMAAVPAFAQGVPDAAASALFREGRDLIKKGDWAQGCPKLAASMKRYPAPSTLLNLALCEEHAGKVATAWAMAQRARVLNRDTKSAKRRQRLDGAAVKLSERLEPRLPRLRVVVVPAVEGVRVLESGSELPLNTAVPLDPGTRRVRVTAPGFEEREREVTLREGETMAVEITLVAKPEPAVMPAPVAKAPQPSPAPVEAPKPVPEADEPQDGIPAWVWISGGVGLALSGVAVGFMVDALSASSELDEICGADLVCDEDLSFDPEPLNVRKNRGTGLAIGLGIGGVAGIVTAAVGLGLHFDRDDAPAGVSIRRWSPWVTPSSAGAVLGGTF